MLPISTPLADISFDESTSILNIKIRDGVRMDLKKATQHFILVRELVGSNDYVALVDASFDCQVEREAWEYASRKEVTGNRVAVAHYNVSLASRLTTTYFKSAIGTTMPFEIFKTKEEAEKWLITFLLQ